MKVYVVIFSEGWGDTVVGIYKHKEDAETKASTSTLYFVEEWEVQDELSASSS